MPGFRITNFTCDSKLNNYKYANTLNDGLVYNDWTISRSTLNEFLNDKLLFENNDYIVLLEGVVLNSNELIIEYDKDNWHDTVNYIITEKENWFSILEGPVSGAVYYKKDDKWVIFTGKLGEKAIFYCVEDGRIIIGSQLNYVTDVMHEKNMKVNPDENALKHFMAYQSYIGSETCIKNVKRLYPGQYLVIKNGEINVKQYCIFDYKQDTNRKSESEYINMLDNAFRNAMQRIIYKNQEYGYKTIADISGGYDSRTNCYVLKSLGAKDVVMDCYAQSGSHDYKVSNAIASELGYDYVFRSLDNASCMYGIDDNIMMLNGATPYAGITGGRDMLQMLTGFNVGLEVTGLLGDVHDGSMVRTRCDGDIDTDDYRDSKTLIEGEDYVFPKSENERFENHVNEHYWFYNRGMIFGMSSFFIRQNFTEAVTPFGDSGFINTYLSIPWEMRVKGKLLQKWLARKYPESAKFIDGKTGMSLEKEINPSYEFIGKVRKQIKIYKNRLLKDKRPKGMNDVSYWYKNNPDFHKYIVSYIRQNKKLIKNYPDIESLTDKLMTSKSVFDILIVVSVLSIFKNFIVNGETENV